VTIGEGIGPIEYRLGGGGVLGVQQLTELRAAPAVVVGRRLTGMATLGGGGWSVTLADVGAGAIMAPLGRAELAWRALDDVRLEIDAEVERKHFHWSGNRAAAGLLGRASYGEKSFVLEFVEP
jgi:hypothetical protein